MASIRGTDNRDTEIKLAVFFQKHGITGWRRHAKITGKPDFVFPKQRLAVFVDGCFWHACPAHGHQPKSNRKYWLAKFARNCQRDRMTNRTLRNTGWRVLRIWAHELNQPERVLGRIKRALLRPTRLLPLPPQPLTTGVSSDLPRGGGTALPTTRYLAERPPSTEIRLGNP
jgi:DNA mismatch endonuclease (patch repair protein)